MQWKKALIHGAVQIILIRKRKFWKHGADVYELINDYPVHTKAVLINDRLQVTVSYNLDMRSTYLDTELMLVIDSEKLNQQIHEQNQIIWKKAKRYLQTVRKPKAQSTRGKC